MLIYLYFSISSKGTLHKIDGFPLWGAYLEHQRLKKVWHGLRHVDLYASQEVKGGPFGAVEVDHLVDEILYELVRGWCGKYFQRSLCSILKRSLCVHNCHLFISHL